MSALLLAALLLAADPAQGAGLDASYEARCAEDGVRLWGRSLCAPVVVVDPATGKHRTSKRAPGDLPKLRANTAFEWAGETWVMALEPLPASPEARTALFFHEAWHAHQTALGFPPNNAAASHLETGMARYLLRMEWAALGEALRASGTARQKHLAQALAFRARRHAVFWDGAAEEERDQMRHEGLAAYTGVALSGAPVRLALEELERAVDKPSLVRSFAYASGPAWGLLLDAERPDWRERIRAGGDLPDLIPTKPAAEPHPDAYGGSAVLAAEMDREARNRTRLAEAVRLTDPARALRLPLTQMAMDFDPNQVTTAPDGSQIHGRITLSDRWGRIRSEGRPLRIAPDFSAAYAPWPLTGAELELAEGWRIEPRRESAVLTPPAP